MAKSIRSKRKRKLRAERREKLKPKLKERLEKMLGVNDKEAGMELEGGVEETRQEKKQEEIADLESNATNTENTGDVDMESEKNGQKKLGKKALQALNKKKTLKRLGKKKRKSQKIMKW